MLISVFFFSNIIKIPRKLEKMKDNQRACVCKQQIFPRFVPRRWTHFSKRIMRRSYYSMTFQGLNVPTSFSEMPELGKCLFGENAKTLLF